tara:strand:+ start:1388 stop:1651 length:264 start_codon:yes stop_codon:yes gene_type:complete
MKDKEKPGEGFLDFLDTIFDEHYKNMFLREKPIGRSREDATLNLDVENFLAKKYEVNIDDKDEDYFSSFIEKLMERTMDEKMSIVKF